MLAICKIFFLTWNYTGAGSEGFTIRYKTRWFYQFEYLNGHAACHIDYSYMVANKFITACKTDMHLAMLYKPGSTYSSIRLPLQHSSHHAVTVYAWGQWSLSTNICLLSTLSIYTLLSEAIYRGFLTWYLYRDDSISQRLFFSCSLIYIMLVWQLSMAEAMGIKFLAQGSNSSS